MKGGRVSDGQLEPLVNIDTDRDAAAATCVGLKAHKLALFLIGANTTFLSPSRIIRSPKLTFAAPIPHAFPNLYVF
ncbi:hypothetical protein J6590_039530 [Homalodisca vitripennis]|nr:hypothetical protein J6590_039530 [Homalodisca vitripennis]